MSTIHPCLKACSFIYGTAWKEERTTELVVQALRAGFRCFDTAAQPRHYREELVGEGIRRGLVGEDHDDNDNDDDNDKKEGGKQEGGEGGLRREDLYIQTKFTARGGQDEANMPYDPTAPLAEQIRASIESSLHHLRPPPTSSTGSDPSSSSYIDCLVLHSPFPSISQTLSAWKTLENYVPHPIRTLGISNTDLTTLQTIYQTATVKPAVVQNRFHVRTGYDGPLRRFCLENGIIYQAFWTLTANRQLVASEPVVEFGNLMGVSKEVAFYALVLGLQERLVILNGTKQESRMRGDLKAVEDVKRWRELPENQEVWASFLDRFKKDLKKEVKERGH